MNTNEIAKEITQVIPDVTKACGRSIAPNSFEVVDQKAPHEPGQLREGKMAVYIFVYNDRVLKIGKAGSDSNARFQSHHYAPSRAKSTLARSLLSDPEMVANEEITESNVGDWIRQNCRRIDIFIDAKLGKFLLSLIEAALQYKYAPKYEGFKNQR